MSKKEQRFLNVLRRVQMVVKSLPHSKNDLKTRFSQVCDGMSHTQKFCLICDDKTVNTVNIERREFVHFRNGSVY